MKLSDKVEVSSECLKKAMEKYDRPEDLGRAWDLGQPCGRGGRGRREV